MPSVFHTRLDGLTGDLRHACRAIVQRPLLSTTVVLSLAVGIGVNTTVFSFIQATEIIGGTMGRVAIGAAVGWAVAAAAYVRLRQAWPDPVIFVTVPLLLSIVAAAASWWPSRRAARIDPVMALRTS